MLEAAPRRFTFTSGPSPTTRNHQLDRVQFNWTHMKRRPWPTPLTLPCTPYPPLLYTPYPPLHPLTSLTRYDPAKSLRINSLDAHASKIKIQVSRSDFQFYRANGHTRPSVGQLHTFFPKKWPRTEGSPSASNSGIPAAVSLISSDSGSD